MKGRSLRTRLYEDVRNEIPACAFGLWVASLWIAIAIIVGMSASAWAVHLAIPAASGITQSDIASALGFWTAAGLFVFAIFGGAAATIGAHAASPRRPPAGWRAALTAFVTASVTTALPALPLYLLLPNAHATSTVMMLFGLRLVADALATEAWRTLAARLPVLQSIATATQPRIGRAGMIVLAAHTLLISLPVIFACVLVSLTATGARPF